MPLPWDRVAELALASLSAAEKQRCAVYIDEQLLAPNAKIRIGDREIFTPWQAVLAFVDLEPGVNWGHRCRYLLVNPTDGEVRLYDEQIPPFLTSVAPTLRLVWKSEDVPDWAVVRP